jgi:hypothetical protein
LSARPFNAVCLAGYGDAGCAQCTYNTFSLGGTLEGQPCTPCPDGTISARLRTDNTQCFPALVAPTKDYMPVSNDNKWVNYGGAATSSAEACGDHCLTTVGCVMYRYSERLQKCQHLLEEPVANPSHVVAFQVGGGVQGEFAMYTMSASLTVGVALNSLSDETLVGCMNACTAEPKCEAFTFPSLNGTVSGTCALWLSELDAEWVSNARADGSKLYADLMLM